MLEQWTARHQSLVDVQHVVYSLFHRLSLSPYTGFVGQLDLSAADMVRADMLGAAAVIDVISYCVAPSGAPLDGVRSERFHHLGANYPDALLLDAMFGEYIGLAARRPDLFLDETGADHSGGGRIRRRGAATSVALPYAVRWAPCSRSAYVTRRKSTCHAGWAGTGA